jgi:hypothetical protein
VFIILPSPIPELHQAPSPPKCYKPKSVPQLLTLPLIHFRFTFESIKELGGASYGLYIFFVYCVVVGHYGVHHCSSSNVDIKIEHNFVLL